MEILDLLGEKFVWMNWYYCGTALILNSTTTAIFVTLKANKKLFGVSKSIIPVFLFLFR